MFGSKFKPQVSKRFDEFRSEFGSLAAEFEAYEPNPAYSWETMKRGPMPSKDKWWICNPKYGPPIGSLPLVIQRAINSTWKYTQPWKDAERRNPGGVVIGTRNVADPKAVLAQTYHTQKRPTGKMINSTMGNADAIASDWGIFKTIPRTNAVAFRGDTRGPRALADCGGFTPPNTRTDRSYLEGKVYDFFSGYLKSRYGRTLTQGEFLRAVDSAAPTATDKALLIDFCMWKRLTDREAAHMGRMVENETLKGYTSTSRSIDTSISFGTAYNSKPGWVYVVLVHGGFVVPWGEKSLWGSEEAEIAQWGEIPTERIVGCMHLDRFKPDSPAFFRRSFIKKEHKAFEYMLDVMSGMTPDQYFASL